MTPEQIASLIEESQTVEPVYRSRVYGYWITKGKTPIIVSAEAEVIRMVVQGLAKSGSLEQIVLEIRSRNIRTRSKRHFSYRSLSALVRPYFAGLERNCSGVPCPVSNYPPIITVREYLAAKRALEQAGML